MVGGKFFLFTFLSLLIFIPMVNSLPESITNYTITDMIFEESFDYNDSITNHGWGYSTFPPTDLPNPVPSVFGTNAFGMSGPNPAYSHYGYYRSITRTINYTNDTIIVKFDYAHLNDVWYRIENDIQIADITLKVPKFGGAEPSDPNDDFEVQAPGDSCLVQNSWYLPILREFIIVIDGKTNKYSVYFNKTSVGNCYNLTYDGTFYGSLKFQHKVLQWSSNTQFFIDNIEIGKGVIFDEFSSLDLSIDSSGISFAEQNGNVDISAVIRNNGGCFDGGVEVKFLDTYNGNLVREAVVNIEAITAGDSATASVNWDLDIGHTVYAIIDPDNKIEETDKGNNNAHKEYAGSLKYYIEADVPPSVANNEIENYIKGNIKNGVIVDNKEEADVIVLIARHNPLIVWHFGTLEEKGWGFYGGTMRFQDETCNKPYCGIIGGLVKDGKKEIYIEANDVDGFVAASKKFIEEQDSFETAGNIIFLDEENDDAIAVYDYLHMDDNLPYYKEDSDEFKEIVKKALDGEMYEEEQINTTANGVTLRLLHLKPDFSDKFIDYKDKLKMPVVLARGLWSNLYTWKDFGEELSVDEGRDTWLIEIIGGPGQDCDLCPNYDFDDLTDSYVPALLNKVLTETDKDELQYVGFSNGCRAALSSLEKGSFDPSKVETFVGVGCPGAFNRTTFFSDVLRDYGEKTINDLEIDQVSHFESRKLRDYIVNNCGLSPTCLFLKYLPLKADSKISLNLFKQYNNWTNSDNDLQPGIRLNLNAFTIIYGDAVGKIAPYNDGVVHGNDALSIFNNIQSNKKTLCSVYRTHRGIAGSSKTKDIIKRSIDNESLSSIWYRCLN